MLARSRLITRSLGVRTFSSTPVRTDGKTIEASSETFDSLVTKAQQPVLVDFYATVLGPLLSKAVADNKQTRLIQIDVDQAVDIAGRYKASMGAWLL
ncbi:hypothetical protein BZG36_01547 [Bifiguratus adelaidae]|uniref:Thioredoxin domain-containing protein n=1 Tax=Bifiguratus adelaidae TaxID=1938954 RepID=A0A261Y473_9FUNG|nr:hypothetical protein BZG36_01547 [Bifiguratus adelaidae]